MAGSAWATVISQGLAGLGMLLTINGAYLYIFYSADKVNPTSIMYGNLYLYVAVPTMVILMVLYLCRNILQDFEKPLFAFLADVGELLARSLICLYLPALVNGGPTNAEASPLSFVFVCMGDPMAWTATVAIMLIPPLIYVYKGSNRSTLLTNAVHGAARTISSPTPIFSSLS